MNEQAIRRRRQRAQLIEQAAAQRRSLAIAAEQWRTPLAQCDQGLAVLRFVRKHSSWITGTVASLAALRPGFFGKWAGRAWIAARLIAGLRR